MAQVRQEKVTRDLARELEPIIAVNSESIGRTIVFDVDKLNAMGTAFRVFVLRVNGLAVGYAVFFVSENPLFGGVWAMGSICTLTKYRRHVPELVASCELGLFDCDAITYGCPVPGSKALERLGYRPGEIVQIKSME